MQLSIYSVYDNAAKCYLAIFTMKTDGEARRWFMDAVSNPETAISRHPSDYTLFRLGSVDDGDGLLVAESAPQALGNGLEYVELEATQRDLKLGSVS